MLVNCLFFTAGVLAREMNARAERAFAATGLTPTQAFALMCIADEPGIHPSTIAEHLALAPSTITRVIDALRSRAFVVTETEGRTLKVVATEQGLAMRESAAVAWKTLYDDYCVDLGQAEADALSKQINAANTALRMKNT